MLKFLVVFNLFLYSGDALFKGDGIHIFQGIFGLIFASAVGFMARVEWE